MCGGFFFFFLIKVFSCCRACRIDKMSKYGFLMSLCLVEIHLYIWSQRRAVFARLCGMIKHRERQTRTLFLPEKHNSQRYDLSPPARTEHLRNASCPKAVRPEISEFLVTHAKPGQSSDSLTFSNLIFVLFSSEGKFSSQVSPKIYPLPLQKRIF